MTYSIVARDPLTGDLAVAVQSKFLAVGSVVPWARAGVGALATQSFANVAYGPDGLGLLASGAGATEALSGLVAGDAMADERQVGIVDAFGLGASFTGRRCFIWAGGRTGPGFAAQGNVLAGPAVVDAMVDTFLEGSGRFPERLVHCLAAADAAGGDRRGRESAALLVVREGGGYGGGNDRWIDLRVDDHVDPIGELARLLDLQRLYLDPPLVSELLVIDATRAADLRAMLRRVGALPGDWTAAILAPGSESNENDSQQTSRPAVGEPRPFTPGWDASWHQALADWMGIENLEERLAAPGWIDPRVLAILAEKAAAGRSS